MKRQRCSDSEEIGTSNCQHGFGDMTDNHESASRGGGKRKGTGDWSDEEIQRLIIGVINNQSILYGKPECSSNDLSTVKISKEARM